MSNYTEPHFTKSALITIDVQNDFTLTGAPAEIAGTQEVIPNMTNLLEIYRNKRLPIVHVLRLYSADGSNVDLCRRKTIEEGVTIVIPGSDGAELVNELKPDASIRLDADELMAGKLQQIGNHEYMLYKSRWGAFYKTPLEAFLSEHEIDTLVFSGCNYPNCPRTSLFEASERDFRVVVVSDAMSQLYSKDKDELKNIHVSLFETKEIESLLD
ncbi:MAG: isochorismatase family cysteine hydrolase [Candidatus Thiodiazotropha sp. 6PLUC5]